jgi:hypothetical protein
MHAAHALYRVDDVAKGIALSLNRFRAKRASIPPRARHGRTTIPSSILSEHTSREDCSLTRRKFEEFGEDYACSYSR